MKREKAKAVARFSFSEIVAKLVGRLSAGDRLFYNAVEAAVSDSGLFHTAIPNNGSYVIIPKQIDPEIFVRDRLINDFNALNKLNILTVLRCTKFVEQIESEDRGDPHCNSLRRALREWKRTSDAGLHYLGPKYAYEFFRSQYVRVDDFRNTLAGELSSHFERIPDILKDAIRIKIGLKLEDLNAFASLVTVLKSEGILLHTGRLEFSASREGALGRKIASVVIQIDTANKVNLREAAKRLRNWYRPWQTRSSLPAWMTPICSGISVGQGFRGYKEYLDSLGIISDQYDSRCNFAFRRRT